MITANDIFSIKTKSQFEAKAIDVFKFQFENNPVYRSFCDLLYKHPSDIKRIKDIPFLPIQFFKTHRVLSSNNNIQKTFTSSGTTGNTTSKHYVTNLEVYKESFNKSFNAFYGKVLLIGVSFALLDLVEAYSFKLNNTIIMETGGMKGRRKELIREELHTKLKAGFGVKNIHSEYGMTELLSQAYSLGEGVFECPNWMKILTRDTEDALSIQTKGKTGGINIIDLANINSCAFIATQDLGRVINTNAFEIIGRFDTSDIRGCNLMVL